MKKFLIILLSFICVQMTAFSVQDSPNMPSVAVITDHILDPPLVYYNYPASSELFANEIANELRLRKNTKIVSSADVKEVLKASTLTPEIKSFENQYRTNHIIDFVKLRNFAKLLGTDNILLVTSSIDPQSYIMKGTIWNVLNISGVDVVNPVYQVITNIALIDVKSETIIWQNLYRKNLKARDFSIIPSSFAPNNQQLKAVSDYSKTLSFQVANSVEENICPYLYFDTMGNKYNKKSNSVIGKTKYYTRSTYEKYVDINVPGAPIQDRYQEHKETHAKIVAAKKQAKQEKKELENQQKLKNAETQNQTYYNNEYSDINNAETKPVIQENPVRDYYQNDSIQITPSKTPNAYGNHIDDL